MLGIVQKFTINLHYDNRLSYTQAEELSLATVYMSQQLYTAEQWLSCKKELGNAIPLAFSSSFSLLFPSPPLPCTSRKTNQEICGSSVICPQSGLGRSPVPYIFWCILSLKIAPLQTPKKKPVSAGSAGTMFKNLYQQKISGGIYNFRGISSRL